MKCKYCGEEIADDSKFCELCGTKIEQKKQIKWWQLILGLIGLTIGGLFLTHSAGVGRNIFLIIIIVAIMKVIAYMKEKKSIDNEM